MPSYMPLPVFSRCLSMQLLPSSESPYRSKSPRFVYFAELDFKYNTRKVTDGERTVDAIRLIGGKRLMLKTPKAQGE